MKSSEGESNVEMNFQCFLSTSNAANNSKAIAYRLKFSIKFLQKSVVNTFQWDQFYFILCIDKFDQFYNFIKHFMISLVNFYRVQFISHKLQFRDYLFRKILLHLLVNISKFYSQDI